MLVLMMMLMVLMMLMASPQPVSTSIKVSSRAMMNPMCEALQVVWLADHPPFNPYLTSHL